MLRNRSAHTAWVVLSPDKDLDVYGTASNPIYSEFGADHEATVRRSNFGTSLFSNHGKEIEIRANDAKKSNGSMAVNKISLEDNSVVKMKHDGKETAKRLTRRLSYELHWFKNAAKYVAKPIIYISQN